MHSPHPQGLSTLADHLTAGETRSAAQRDTSLMAGLFFTKPARNARAHALAVQVRIHNCKMLKCWNHGAVHTDATVSAPSAEYCFQKWQLAYTSVTNHLFLLCLGLCSIMQFTLLFFKINIVVSVLCIAHKYTTNEWFLNGAHHQTDRCIARLAHDYVINSTFTVESHGILCHESGREHYPENVILPSVYRFSVTVGKIVENPWTDGTKKIHMLHVFMQLQRGLWLGENDWSGQAFAII